MLLLSSVLEVMLLLLEQAAAVQAARDDAVAAVSLLNSPAAFLSAHSTPNISSLNSAPCLR